MKIYPCDCAEIRLKVDAMRAPGGVKIDQPREVILLCEDLLPEFNTVQGYDGGGQKGQDPLFEACCIAMAVVHAKKRR